MRRGLCLAWLALGCARVGAMKGDDGGAADRPGVDLQITPPDGSPLADGFAPTDLDPRVGEVWPITPTRVVAPVDVFTLRSSGRKAVLLKAKA